MSAPTITALPDAPRRTEDAATFATKAEAFVTAMEGMPAEYNALAEFVESAAATAAEALEEIENFTQGPPGPSGTVTSNTGIVVDPSTVVNNSFSRIALDQQAPTSGMVNSIGGNDAVNLRLIQNGGRTTNGPTAQPNYYNTVLALGFNCTNSYTPLNTSMPSGSYRIESKFAQGQPTDPFMSEYHMASHFPVDWATPGVGEFRAVTATVPHNSADYNSIHCAVGQRGAMHIVWDWAGRQRILYDFTTAGGGVIDYMDGGSGQGHPKLRFNTNNKPALEQINAAGTSLLPLPFIESSDGLRISQSVRITGNAAANASYGGTPTILGAFITGGMNDGAYLSAITASQTITGTVNGQYLQANATVKLESEARNFGSGGKTGQKLTAAGGDTYYELRDATNDRSFTFNHIASTGKLQLNDAIQGGQFASKFAFEIDHSKFQVSFGYAPKLPSSTVGSLPAAGTAGAGSLHYVTGLNSTAAGSVAAGGGSNKGVVVSDGSDWRIMTAWA
jgi:hypothetical protein